MTASAPRERDDDLPGTEGPVLESLGELFIPLWPVLLALLVSHGISFATSFLGRREHAGRSASDQMSKPYKRVIVLHLTIIFGGWVILLLGSPLPALILLIILKTAVDLTRSSTGALGAGPSLHKGNREEDEKADDEEYGSQGQ